MRGKFLTRWCLAAVLTFALLACVPAQMAVPPEVASRGGALQVQGRQGFNFSETFNFGGYAVESVDRGWTRSTAWGGFGYEDFSAFQEVSFVLRTPEGHRWNCGCATTADARMLRFIFPESRSEMTWDLTGGGSYVCALQGADGSVWRLGLGRPRTDALLSGVLHDTVTHVGVEGTRQLAGSSFPLGEATGYVFNAHHGRVAAVEVINEGRVWLPQDMHLRGPIAAASAALLLFQEIGPE